ncbi:MAG: hypothetical protein R6U96_18330 [Promethearchaeia archaeon]
MCFYSLFLFHRKYRGWRSDILQFSHQKPKENHHKHYGNYDKPSKELDLILSGKVHIRKCLCLTYYRNRNESITQHEIDKPTQLRPGDAQKFSDLREA